jgi:hypothetical protein
MSSTERVLKYREAQEKAGRKLVSVYLPPEVIEQMKKATRPRTCGELVEVAVADYLSRNGQIAERV